MMPEDTLIIQMKLMKGAWMSLDDLIYRITTFWYEFLKAQSAIDTSKIIVEGGYTFF